MADMNYRILKKINKEIEREVAKAELSDSNETILMGNHRIRAEKKERFKNLLDLKDMLEKANKQANNLYLFGEIGICKDDYLKFMHLLHDPETNIPIPKNLYAYGIIPKYNIPTPPIAPDNRNVNDIEAEYQMFYAKYGIVAEYENGIRKPYPHEMYDWNIDGAIESSYGKAHNYYYEKRYLVAKQQELVNTETTTDENKQNEVNVEDKPKEKKRFRIFKRHQATEEEKEKMAESVDKSQNTAEYKKKKLKKTLILSAIAVGVTAIAFNAAVVLPAMFSNPAMFGTVLANMPGFIFQNFGNLMLQVGLPATVSFLILRYAIKKSQKKQLEQNENAEEKENKQEETIDPKVLLEKLKQKIIENEQKISQKDAEIEQAKNYTVPRDKEMALQAEKDALNKLRQLQEEREELLRLKHQILSEMASHTVVPETNGGMKR